MNASAPSADAPPHRSPAGALWSLFVVSGAALFLELALIRWISGEVRIFAYLQSTVLVVCMLGLGMGCFSQHQAIPLARSLRALVGLAVLIGIPPWNWIARGISDTLAEFGDLPIWTGQLIEIAAWRHVVSVIGALALAIIILALVLIAFLPLGQKMARLIDDHPNTIQAYSVNIGGSGLGIALFTLASVFGLSPPLWFLAIAVALLALLPVVERARPLTLLLALATPALIWTGAAVSERGDTFWSPYQKLIVEGRQLRDKTTGVTLAVNDITTNNILFQSMLDLRPETLATAPSLFNPDWSGLSQYDLPLLVKPKPDQVLIVGAGSGNDVAAALRGGAGHVVGVEIDPVIVDLGRRLHPEHPYQSPAVEVVIDDARSYFARTDRRFDLIIFGLLDSHTTGQMTNARLDNYVYTTESIARARDLLAPGGVMVLAFEANKPYLSDRIFTTLRQIFGSAPLVIKYPTTDHGLGGVLFVSGDQAAIEREIAANPRLAAHIQRLQDRFPVPVAGTTTPTTDDWPYLYMEKRTIPPLFGLFVIMLAGLYWGAGRSLGMGLSLRSWALPEWHFFAMGAAFMLLEVTMIARTTVVLGNTWMVNAVIIGGILAMILTANWLTARWPELPRRLVFTGLLGACAVVVLVNPVVFADYAPGARVLMVAVMATVPMLFSGIVFIRSFASVPDKTRALGANLTGSLVGGLLQAVTYASGIQFLLLLVAGLYLAAVLTAPRPRTSPPVIRTTYTSAP